MALFAPSCWGLLGWNQYSVAVVTDREAFMEKINKVGNADQRLFKRLFKAFSTPKMKAGRAVKKWGMLTWRVLSTSDLLATLRNPVTVLRANDEALEAYRHGKGVIVKLHLTLNSILNEMD